MKENDPTWPTQRAGIERTTQGFLCSAFYTGYIAKDRQSIESDRSEGKFKTGPHSQESPYEGKGQVTEE